MLSQLSGKERFGYLALSVIVLFAFGWVGAQALRRPPDITIQPLADTKPQAPAPSEVVVHVVGAVKSPGMVRMAADSRVDDAIRKCGGAKAGADLEAINLAAKLEDGTQLNVPLKGKVEPEKIAEPYRGGGSEAYASKPASSSTSGSSSSRKDPTPKSVSLNSAGQSQLESLPGIGPATAKKILEYRKAHGGFSSVDELLAVKGIGPKKLEAMRPFVKL